MFDHFLELRYKLSSLPLFTNESSGDSNCSNFMLNKQIVSQILSVQFADAPEFLDNRANRPLAGPE